MRKGDVVADRFEIEQLAGAGAMGSIFRAQDRTTGDRVALKTLRTESGAFADRFAREGRILAELTHPAIVRYVAHGTTTGGALFLAMEWLDGEDLLQRLKRMGLTLGETVALGIRAVGALAAAHAHGVVHRDIKPANIFLPGRDVTQAKILDFGVARANEVSGTKTGFMVGTPGYMSPEQARGQKSIDARADLFSLGCVLYQCLAGRPPFVADDMLAVLAKLVFEEPPRVSELRPDVPVALDELIAQLMSKAPEGRPASAEAVGKALAALGVSVHDDGTRPSHAPAPPPAITGAEQRLVSVVLATADPRGADAGRSDEGQRVGAVVRPFGAEVIVLVDGALMVTLAADGEPTDQAAQAARCALAMQRELPGRDIVLGTGRRVLGGPAPFGEVIDRAAALLRSAREAQATGRVSVARCRLDDVTAGLLDSRFEVGGDALSLFLAGEREELEHAARTLLGKITPCVGRDRELAILDATFAECLSESVPRAVLVTAPVGFGKSRLRHEFLSRLAERTQRSDGTQPADVWIARGDPMGVGSPFRMVGQAIRRTAGLLDGESLSVRRQKIRARVARYIDGEGLARVSEFLGELCGVPFPDDDSVQLRAARQDPMRMGDQMRRAFEDFLAAECAARPVLVVLEDLHWGDLPSAQWIESALRNLKDRPLMILALARPEVHDLFPQLWVNRGVQTIVLGELGKKACEKLIRHVFGERIKVEVVNEIVDRAGGNAFYLEEMIRAVAEGRGDRLPATVLAMVQARLDRLEADARRVLRAASIFGPVFWAGGVRALLGEEEAIQPSEWLEELTKREVIMHRPSEKFPGDKEYAFRNAPVRDAAYASFTEEDRILGHKLAAEWLEKAGEADAVVLAEHFQQGGQQGRAVSFYLKSAEHALEGNDFAAALKRAERGIVCGAAGEVRGALASIQAEAHKWQGNNVESEARFAEALALFPRGSDGWLKALADLATVRAKMGQHEPLLALATELYEMPFAHASTRYATAAARVAIQLLHTGHLEAADGLLGSAEAAASATAPHEEGFTPSMDPRRLARADPAMAASIYQARGIRAMFWGDVGAFLGFMTAAAEHFELAGDLRSAGTQRANQAYAYIELGAYAAAEQSLRQVLATAERMGLKDLAAGARNNLGIALARMGALDDARSVEIAAVRASVAQSNRRLESGCRTYLAIILLLGNDLAGAEREARAAVDILSVAPPMRAHALGTLSRVLRAQGRPREALTAAEEAMKLMHSVSGIEEGESLIRLAYVEALGENGLDARGAIAVAADRLRQRADRISDPAWRASFLENVPDNARIVELSRVWLGQSW
jgi:eukaryotic-like serine/threonine-protein kinase